MVKQGTWIRKANNAPTVVFIHGINSSDECWRNQANGAYWPDLLKENDTLSSLGIYSFSYQTNLFSGNYRLGDVVDSLKENLLLDDVIEYPQVVFVCHSMGGIIARRYLVQEQTYSLKEKKVKEVGLFLVASPSLGSNYANLLNEFARILNHTQADALRFSQNNTWLNDLDRDFLKLNQRGDLFTIKGKELVEDKFRFGRLQLPFFSQVVEPFSGARYFGDSLKVPDSDHFTIAKPDSKDAIQHRLLCQFIKDNLTLSGVTDNVTNKTKSDDTKPDNKFFPNIPTPNYIDLLGRDNEISKIKNALVESKGNKIVGISGLGGTGKTAVAIEVARSFRELGFQKIVWQTASSASAKSLQEASRMTFEKVLDEIAKQLSRRDLLILQGEDRKRRTLEILSNERVLLVLDNMETSGEPQAEIAEKLSQILGNSKLLLTSRRRFQTLETDIFDYHLRGLGKEAGIELIKETASQKNISALQNSDLEPLIDLTGNDRMGYSPLAVKFIVGQRGHQDQKEISRKLENIRLPQNDEELNDQNLFSRFWSRIFSESYQLMNKADETLFSILVALDPSHGTSHDTIYKMLNSSLTQDEIDRAISHTWELSLLERENQLNKPLYSMHLLTNRFFVKMLKKYS
jgi:pimeloyl-ACP methyl ester carboxylesterase/Cdc6-like AAA superfamily ATPase